MVLVSDVVPLQEGPYFCRATRLERLGFFLVLVVVVVDGWVRLLMAVFCFCLTRFGSKKRLRIYSSSFQFNFKSKFDNNYGHQILAKFKRVFI